MDRGINRKFIFIVLFVSMALVKFFLAEKTLMTVDLSTDLDSTFQVFWAEEEGKYNEGNSIGFKIKKGSNKYQAYLPGLKSIRYLRIDPLSAVGTITIKNIEFRQDGYETIVFNNERSFSKVVPLHHIKELSYKDNMLIIVSSGNDPYLQIKLQPKYSSILYSKALVLSFLIFGVCSAVGVLLLSYVKNIFLKYLSIPDGNFFACLMFVILGLIISMSVVSAYHCHPDEYHHVEAAEYYFYYWLPPAVGDPRGIDSYSVYGMSYLDELDIVYFLAAKFSALILPLLHDFNLSLRLFNVTLFLIISMFCLFKRRDRALFLVLLISPQIWYIFSYFNGDAFPLFITMLIVYQITSEESIFNKFLNSPSTLGFKSGAILMGSYLGLLALSKRNYIIFLLFILFLFIESIYSFKVKRERLTRLLKYLLVICIALTIFFPRYIYDVVQNGIDKRTLRINFADKIAAPQFKPSAPLEDTYYGSHLRSKNVKYTDLFYPPWNWHSITFKSAVGTYGYLEIWSPKLYYRAIKWFYLAFAIFLAISILMSGRKKEAVVLFITGLFVLIMVFISFYHSWVDDFQAQGRYLFPVYGMLAALINRNKYILHEGILFFFGFALFCLSSFSFLFTGINFIQK